jgi:acyl-CoA thioesterase|tara:strand:- start:19159 stop:19953 length:795 start_codon:yes stop_codon:yes gene_type:complete
MSQFAEETAIECIGDNIFRGELHAQWRIGAVPNGGYVLAIAGRALRAVLPHKDPLSVNAFYLAPTVVGPIECRVEILRSGRSTSFAEVGMYQEGELKIKVTAAFTDLDRLTGENWSAAERVHQISWDECEPSPDQGLEFRERVELRLVSGKEVFSERKTNGSGEFCGWVQLRDGSAPDVMSLLMFADSFPPPIFTVYGLVGWVPTVELTVQVRGHPAPGPLQVRLFSQHLTSGVVEEDGEIWDSAGRLVAISRQTAKFRLPKGK